MASISLRFVPPKTKKISLVFFWPRNVAQWPCLVINVFYESTLLFRSLCENCRHFPCSMSAGKRALHAICHFLTMLFCIPELDSPCCWQSLGHDISSPHYKGPKEIILCGNAFWNLKRPNTNDSFLFCFTCKRTSRKMTLWCGWELIGPGDLVHGADLDWDIASWPWKWGTWMNSSCRFFQL